MHSSKAPGGGSAHAAACPMQCSLAAWLVVMQLCRKHNFAMTQYNFCTVHCSKAAVRFSMSVTTSLGHAAVLHWFLNIEPVKLQRNRLKAFITTHALQKNIAGGHSSQGSEAELSAPYALTVVSASKSANSGCHSIPAAAAAKAHHF